MELMTLAMTMFFDALINKSPFFVVLFGLLEAHGA
jgi:hypothetical protein